MVFYSSYSEWEHNVLTRKEDNMNDQTTTVDMEADPMIEQAKQFFHKMLDIMANATQLAKDVKSLREEVAQLRGEVEETRARNVHLDNQINALRAERDQYASDLASTRSELQIVTIDRDNVTNRNTQLESAIASVTNEYNAASQRWTDASNQHSAELSAIVQERDQLRAELADTQRRFRELEERVRTIAASLSPNPIEQQPTQPEAQEEPRRSFAY